eukprot:gnl/TRDRNA2_/TRDRNA2_118215_c0_seq1.p2 gnl/TRDRNA2_/TRDRNA2_118215_c0~~gnl/TRDRNA2_/TRDRNA2_118215_c0_seq1.p2  ORF type:complete len:128 (+),score=9.61 gnl/TRDRNA2_/TRDRNA2_118215_c0_seq1:260-643(+)
MNTHVMLRLVHIACQERGADLSICRTAINKSDKKGKTSKGWTGNQFTSVDVVRSEDHSISELKLGHSTGSTQKLLAMIPLLKASVKSGAAHMNDVGLIAKLHGPTHRTRDIYKWNPDGVSPSLLRNI